MEKIILPILIAFIDQLTKFFIEKYLYFKQTVIINNVLLFTYVQNKGGAWGIFNDIPLLFIILIPVLVVGLGFYSIWSKNKVDSIAIGMVIGGALGNYIDRILRGYVVDFIDFRVWPVFNVADVFVVIGGILLVFGALKGVRDGK